jgi:hypothetical protein
MELLGALVVARKNGLTEENIRPIDAEAMTHAIFIKHSCGDCALRNSTR